MEETTRDAILRMDAEISEVKTELKTITQALKDEEQHSETYKQLQEAKEVVKTLKAQLRAETDSSRDLVKLKTEQAELKFKLGDLREILSHHLVQYQRETDDTQVPLADGVYAKQITLKAKLSNKEDFYQERMAFGANAGVISDSDGQIIEGGA